METVDGNFLDRAKSFMRRNTGAGKPWMTWMNTSRMHSFTRLRPESRGVTGLGISADGMVEYDRDVGQLLDLPDELKITDDTIVIDTADNGPHFNEWPELVQHSFCQSPV